MAAVASVYRRELCSPAIEFASLEGKQLFAEALGNGNLEGFFKLISYYQTQSEPAYCGLATLAMVLNALGIDPGRKWKGPWRWFDDAMLDCCESLEKVKVNGISFGKLACLALCNGANVETFRATESNVDDFRDFVMSCTSSEGCHAIVSYHRQHLEQTGSGHFSPIGGYHAGRDMVLILDVARFKYPPHWVPLTLLWKAMNTVDEATGLHRGYMLVSKKERTSSILYTLSCHHDGWDISAKYLTEEVPVLVSSKEIKGIQEILSTVFISAPVNLRDFIVWVVEVRKHEDGSEVFSEEERGRLTIKEELLRQVQETELYKYVTGWILSESSGNYNASSAGQLSFDNVAYEVCCQGAQLLCGKISFSNWNRSYSISSETLRHSNDQSIRKITGKVIVENAELGEEMLIPCRTNSVDDSLCQCDSNASYGKHPSADDILTVLILALPPDTWSGIKDKRLREQFLDIVSINNLPDLLQQEVLHLRRQLHYVTTTDACSP